MRFKYTLALLLCSTASMLLAQDKFTITGTMPQAGPDKMVLLSFVNAAGKSVTHSTTLTDGKFSISGLTAFGNKAYLELKPKTNDNGKRRRADYREFYLEKGNTIVKGTDSMATAMISGTKVQSENLEYHSKMDPWQAKYQQLVARYFKAKAIKDTLELKQISIDGKPVGEKMLATVDDFILSHPDSYVSADLVLENKMTVVDVVKFEPMYKALSPRVISSFSGKKITDKFLKAKQFAVGKNIDFTLPDKDGKEFKLSSLKGKYVLIDFWASWCVPCRAENPYLLKAYNELKSKNFEIVGVSLDDKKAAWLQAVQSDQMPWTQVSDVKGFKTEVAVRFGITAIPQNVLLDPQGKVIAKDLRGPDVNTKIAAYLK
jgi:thiol-disulfide isomerase/thioredoxin